MVFTELDHATAAVKNGLTLPARTVIVFGNPRAGTPNMQKAPTLAIDVPRKLSFGKMTKERSGSPSTPGNTYTITSIRRMDYRPIRWPLKPSTNSSCTLPSKPPNNEALCCRARIRDMTEAVIEGKLYPNATFIPASASVPRACRRRCSRRSLRWHAPLAWSPTGTRWSPIPRRASFTRASSIPSPPNCPLVPSARGVAARRLSSSDAVSSSVRASEAVSANGMDRLLPPNRLAFTG